jgi:heme-degrading monooxygenase HmoA
VYLVLFKAKINQLDAEYEARAQALRVKAKDYGCLGFESYMQSNTDGDVELALSYWESEEDIRAWRDDEEHQQAQKLGHERYYKSVEIEVHKLQRSYGTALTNDKEIN